MPHHSTEPSHKPADNGDEGKPFGTQLRDARLAAGISVSELARRARTSRSRIYEYENGKVSPTVAAANRLLRCIDLTLVIREWNDSS